MYAARPDGRDLFPYPFGALRFHRVRELHISTDNTILVSLTDTEAFVFEARGEGRNRVWFNHISGLDTLLGKTVRTITYKEWAQVPEGSYTRDDLAEEAVFWDLVTSDGMCTIEVRNSNNGHYSGDIHLIARYPLAVKFKKVTEDF